MSNTISAANNPSLANQLVDQAISTPVATENKLEITPPSDTHVSLPGGYITPSGEVTRDAEVRELDGQDEEALSKATSIGRAILLLVNRGTVSVGGQKADEAVMDGLLAGDRDALLIGIAKATFGPTVDVSTFCSGCNDFKEVRVSLDEDLKNKVLVDPIADRVFTVQGKVGEIVVEMPNGATQKLLIDSVDKTPAEMNSILLERTVKRIAGNPVYSRIQVQKLGIQDRRLVLEELEKRVPGPRLSDVTIPCPDCGGEVLVPINFGTLFRF